VVEVVDAVEWWRWWRWFVVAHPPLMSPTCYPTPLKMGVGGVSTEYEAKHFRNREITASPRGEKTAKICSDVLLVSISN